MGKDEDASCRHDKAHRLKQFARSFKTLTPCYPFFADYRQTAEEGRQGVNLFMAENVKIFQSRKPGNCIRHCRGA